MTSFQCSGKRLETNVIGPTVSTEGASQGTEPADLVVLRPLGRIADDVVGRRHLLELGLGALIAGVHIRVVLASELAERARPQRGRDLHPHRADQDQIEALVEDIGDLGEGKARLDLDRPS